VPARPRPNRSARLASLLLLGLLGGACASIPPRAPSISAEATAAIARLEERWRLFGDLRTLADVRIRRGDRNQTLTGVLLLRAPASLRFEALSPFGPPVLLVASDGESTTLWEVLRDRAFILPASADATRRWLGLSLGAEEVVALLSGHVLPLKDPEEADLVREDGAPPALALRRGDTVQRIRLDPGTGRAVDAEWSGGTRALRVAFSARGPVDAPAGLSLSTPDGELEVRISYRKAQVDSGLDQGLFSVTVPEHVKIQDFR
jgi:outer membrane lipoprotein-sorting protein